ncbi:MAG: von Willebrand factor type A domain protein [uncultured archaeon A07HR67]|nr:MAG: von Willebrand factor type A domain protein [uncultured archaeon A07HR67]
MRLTASTSLQSIQERLGAGSAETLRRSEKRRRYLQTYVRLLTRSRPSIRFSSDLRTAVTDYGADDPEIRITTRAFDQPVTDFRRRVFDLAVQEALVVHEAGHIQYTDGDGLHELLTRVDSDRRRLFSRIWNTLEDGAVERQLRHRYAVAPELEILNANLFYSSVDHTNSAADEQRLSFFNAVVCGLADMAIYDSGRFQQLRADGTAPRMASLRDERILAEFVPIMRSSIKEVLTEPDPTARNEHIWSFWTALVDALDAATISGAEASKLDRLIDADGTVRATQADSPSRRRTTDAVVLSEPEAGVPFTGKPNDAGGEPGSDAQTACDLGRDAVADELTRQLASVLTGDEHSPTTRAVANTTPPDGENHDTDTSTASMAHENNSDRSDSDTSATDGVLEAQSHPGSSQLPGEQQDTTRGNESSALPAQNTNNSKTDGNTTSTAQNRNEPEREADGPENQTAAALRQRYTKELAAEASELDKAEHRINSLETYVDALGAVDTDADIQVVTESDDDGGATTADRWSTVRRDATLLAQRFRSRLQEQRRDVERSRCRRGSIDRSRLVGAVRGQPDIFTQTEEGENRRYTCVVVLDRSGSMDDETVAAAEQGALTATVALEAIGVDVAVLDLYDSTVRLIKTTVEEASNIRGRILTTQARGGTPLTEALSLAQARFADVKNPFVIVVTDGLPDDETAYTAALDAATFPVLGVYLTGADYSGDRAVETDRSYFHQLALIEDPTRLTIHLQRLAGRVLF